MIHAIREGLQKTSRSDRALNRVRRVISLANSPARPVTGSHLNNCPVRSVRTKGHRRHITPLQGSRYASSAMRNSRETRGRYRVHAGYATGSDGRAGRDGRRRRRRPFKCQSSHHPPREERQITETQYPNERSSATIAILPPSPVHPRAVLVPLVKIIQLTL